MTDFVTTISNDAVALFNGLFFFVQWCFFFLSVTHSHTLKKKVADREQCFLAAVEGYLQKHLG